MPDIERSSDDLPALDEGPLRGLYWRQRAEEAEAEVERLREALERATALAEKYGEAIVQISEALPNENRARLIIAALDAS